MKTQEEKQAQKKAVTLDDVKTYAQREKAMKVAKAGKRDKIRVGLSRVPWRMARRAPVRDSKRAYRVKFIHAQPLSTFLSFATSDYHPTVPTARLPKTAAETLLHDEEATCNERAPEQAVEATARVVIDLVSSDDEEDDTDCIDLVSDDEVNPDQQLRTRDEQANEQDNAGQTNGREVPWPANVIRMVHTMKPDGILLQDAGDVDWCGCVGECAPDSCQNAATDLFCSSNNCKLGSKCGNRRRDANGLELRRGNLGYCVVATAFIASGSVVGEYAGILTDYNCENDERERAYTMSLDKRSTAGKKLWIDSENCGSLMRFVNHSCDTNSGFFETYNRRRVAVLVYALKDIYPGMEITAKYGDELWFECKCGASDCVGNK